MVNTHRALQKAEQLLEQAEDATKLGGGDVERAIALARIAGVYVEIAKLLDTSD